MKKRLLLLLCLSATLIGCGEVTVSYKGSGQKTSRTTSTSTEVVEYDPYYGINYSSTNKDGVDDFIIMLPERGYSGMYSDSPKFPNASLDNTFNVTPSSISTFSDIKVFYVKDTCIFFQLDGGLNNICYLSTSSSRVIQKMGFQDYDSNGTNDIAIWSYTGKNRGYYYLEYLDVTDGRLFNVCTLYFESKDDFEFSILNSSSSGPVSYINNKRVYYVRSQFVCTGIFDYRYPSYY